MKMSNSDKIEKKNQEYWRSEVDEIRRDSLHGSHYLADLALVIIEKFIEKKLYNNRTELFQSYSKLVNALVRAKPLMALIYTRSHQILDFIDNFPKEERNIKAVQKMILDEIQNIRTESSDREKSLIKYGARMILDQHILLTHSSSSVVQKILMQAKRLKKHFRVVCTESRPLFEGRELAIRLAKAGIKTRLIPDADIPRVIKGVNMVMTGVDRVTETSFINKTGSYSAAIIAKELQIPFYIALDTAKILPKRTYPAKYVSVNVQEILDKKINDLTAENYYFEEIPLTYVHKVVCEAGIFETEEFIERFLKF
jgi:translation initiation factor 2B subunit (eIF-2B alpha/beta/delta family)